MAVKWVSVMWQPFDHFFIMADANFLFPLTLRKAETQTLGGQQLEILLYDEFLWCGSHFFIIDNANLPFLSTLRKVETQTLGGSVIGNFTVHWDTMALQPFFHFYNGCHPFSISVDIKKTGDPNFGGLVVGNLLYNKFLWCGSHFSIFA